MNITVYCGSSAGANPRFLEAARELGSWIAASGHALVYGGSSIGLMGAVSRAALDGGAVVHGVEPRFFIEAGVAQHDLTHLHVTETMAQRKAKMVELGDAFVALPGGVGTLEEISEIMSRIRLGRCSAPCCLLNIDGYYDAFKAFLRTMLGEGFIAPEDFERFRFPCSVAEFAAIVDEQQAHPAAAHATAAELAGHA